MSIHIGTSGWHYPHWVDRFYPAGRRREDRLEYYSRHFECTEVNNMEVFFENDQDACAVRDALALQKRVAT